jgi:glycosyltransferase involved in cell wall biosynthesis
MGSERLKILFFMSSLAGGGAERQVTRLLQHLDRRRFEPRLAVARLVGELRSEVPDDVPVFGLAPSWAGRSSIGVMASVRPLRRMLRDWQPHLIYSRMKHSNFASLRAIHGVSPPPKAVVCLSNTLSTHAERRLSLFGRYIRQALPSLYEQSDAVICISEGIRREFESYSPAAAGKAVVIYNVGLDDGQLSRAADAIDEGTPPRPLVVACGRLTRQKGFDLLIQAIAQVRRHLPVHLWILGQGPERDALQALIDGLGLGSSVRLLGFKEHPVSYFAKADAFVLSSRWEGFGSVLIEAMACGAPVLSTRCEWGPAEIISHGVNGLLCEPDSPEALGQGMLTLLQDRELATRLSAAARIASERYSVSAIVGQHEDLFRRTVGA